MMCWKRYNLDLLINEYIADYLACMAALLREIPLGDVDNAIGLFQDNYEGGCIRAKYTIYALCIFTDRH